MRNPSTDPDALARGLSRLLSPEWVAAHPTYMAAMAEAALHPIPEYARKLHYQASEGHDAWELLPTIKAPTLVIHGSNDQVNMTANAPLLAERIPGAELYIVEFREEVGGTVKAFLAHHPL